jgi:hypothetical protein
MPASQRFASLQTILRGASFFQSAFRIDVNKSIQLGIKLLDFRKMGFYEYNRGDFFVSNPFSHLDG